MGGEGFFGALAGMGIGALVGLVISFVVKLAGRRSRLPGWPVLLSSIVFGLVPAVVQNWRYPH